MNLIELNGDRYGKKIVIDADLLAYMTPCANYTQISLNIGNEVHHIYSTDSPEYILCKITANKPIQTTEHSTK